MFFHICASTYEKIFPFNKPKGEPYISQILRTYTWKDAKDKTTGEAGILNTRVFFGKDGSEAFLQWRYAASQQAHEMMLKITYTDESGHHKKSTNKEFLALEWLRLGTSLP